MSGGVCDNRALISKWINVVITAGWFIFHITISIGIYIYDYTFKMHRYIWGVAIYEIHVVNSRPGNHKITIFVMNTACTNFVCEYVYLHSLSEVL